MKISPGEKVANGHVHRRTNNDTASAADDRGQPQYQLLITDENTTKGPDAVLLTQCASDHETTCGGKRHGLESVWPSLGRAIDSRPHVPVTLSLNT